MGGEANEILWRGVRPIEGIRGVWPERNTTRLHAEASRQGTAAAIVYTVPSGKRAFITTSIFTSRLAVAGSQNARLGIRDGSDVHSYWIMNHYYDTEGQQTTAATFMPALEIEADYDVYILNGVADLDSATVLHGWLEDA